MYLSDLLRDKLERLTRRKTSLTVEEKVMIALQFFASGSHLQVILLTKLGSASTGA
jgi:hypothetical protein